MATRLESVIEQIDRLNAQDPRGYELPYSQWITDWVKRLSPKPSEELLIAARGQHVQRWTVPRDRYPRDRTGYLAWRETLKKFHAETVAGLMRTAGYPEKSVQKVERIILKKNIREPESQIIEDALCLVFLERQFADLARKEPEEKMIEILRKSWRKMGKAGRAEALKLPLCDSEKSLLKKACSA
ncbi:MAG: DUF4202 domain-containing protein [Candidatus Omnitrophica bacterium]|nr:DUF4202 domain-containing protein [Candidatus Omnitrophota bacterium]